MIGTLLERLFIAVGVDLSGFGTELEQAARDVDRTANRMERSFADVGRSWQQTGASMMQSGAVMSAAVTAPLVLFGTHAIRAASDAQEMASAFDVVFGEMADDVEAWAERTGDAMGRSTQEMQRGALAFMELFSKALDPRQAAEMSQTFATLTQDLASFKNLSNEVAQQKLFAGLTGEAEPLRAVGVFINEARVEAQLLAMGIEKVNGAYTDQQKILGRAAIIQADLAAANGDVLRTSDSLANQQRTANAAWEELSVTVGTKLIPAITPLVLLLTDALNGLNSLDPGFQTFILGSLAVAAAIGPLLMGLGAIVSAAGAVLPLLGSAGLAGVMGTLATVFLPVTAAVAALAAAWVLFGDQIGPALSSLWETIQSVLGPKLLTLLSMATSALMALWSGPLGIFIRNVVETLGQLGASLLNVLGQILIRVVGVALDVVTGAFTGIGNAIRLVVALLSGDFSGAWQAAGDLVSGMVQTMIAVLNTLVPGAGDALRRMVVEISRWIVDRLNAIWDGVKARIEAVKGWFFDLYDAVVGNSYIPDMVDEIGQNMSRLQALMVDPARRATQSTREAFADLASDVSGVLDRLYPLRAELRAVMDDIAALEEGRRRGIVDPATYSAARGDLEMQRSNLERGGPLEATLITPAALEEIRAAWASLTVELGKMPRVASEAEIALREMGEMLGDDIMRGLRDVLTGRTSLKDYVRDLFGGFFERTITDALRSLEGSIFGQGGLGGWLGGLFSSVIGGRAVGGPVVPGRAYTVGMGEKFVPSQPGRVLSRNDAMRAIGGGTGAPLAINVTVNGARGNAEIMEMVREGVAQGIGNYDRVVGDRVNDNVRRRA